MSNSNPTNPPDLSALGLEPTPGIAVRVNGTLSQVYRTAPGKPLPNPVPDYQDWELVVAGVGAGSRGYALYRNPRINPSPKPLPMAPAPIVVAPPVVKPTPSVTPTPPTPVTRIVCPNPDDPAKQFAGIELDRGTDVVLRDTHVDGFSQNIVYQNLSGSALLDNVRSCRAWRRTPGEVYDGNGFYFKNIAGGVTMRNCLARGNGWRAGKAAKELSSFRHSLYGDFGVNGYTLDTGIFSGAAGSNLEARGKPVIRNWIFLDAATALAFVMAGFEIYDSTIYDGHGQAALKLDPVRGYVVDAWTAHVALSYCCDGFVRNTWIVTRPNQGAAIAALAPTAKMYPQGCVVGSRQWGGMGADHPDYKPQATPPKLDVKDCTIAGPWPGKTFAGDTPHTGDGFAIKGTTGKDYDPAPVLDAVEANEISVAEAVRTLTDSIRGLVV